MLLQPSNHHTDDSCQFWWLTYQVGNVCHGTEPHLIVDDSQRHTQKLTMLIEKTRRGHIKLVRRAILRYQRLILVILTALINSGLLL